MAGFTPALRRYNIRVLGLSIAYAALLLGAVWLFKHRPPAGAFGYLVAALPAFPIIGIFVALGQYLVEEADEYLRMLMIRQSLIATGISLSVATLYGFIEDAGLAPHVPTYHVAVVWFAGFGLGAIYNSWRERGGAA